MAFSRQEYWSGLPCSPPGDLPNLGMEPRSPALQADSWPSESPRKPENAGVGGLSLLQGIFPTQELNRDGNPLQYSYLENPMDGGAWWATVHGVTKSRTWLSHFTHFTPALQADSLPAELSGKSMIKIHNGTIMKKRDRDSLFFFSPRIYESLLLRSLLRYTTGSKTDDGSAFMELRCWWKEEHGRMGLVLQR